MEAEHQHTARRRSTKRRADRISEETQQDETRAELELGKLADYYAAQVQREGSWAQFIRAQRGKSNIPHKVDTLAHRASRLLHHLSVRGASVTLTTPPWDHHRISEAMSRGPHKSS